MENSVVEWQDKYNVGVDFIDKAHQQLFLVIFRFQSVIEEKDQTYRKAVCASMFRYLRQYTLNHFAQEEGYMRKIQYPGYEVHKHLHDNLKIRTLPNLVAMMEEEKYSDEAIMRCIAILSSWLSSHILIEDRAISGSEISRWGQENHKSDVVEEIDREFRLFVEDLFGLRVELINRHYEGEYIGSNFYAISSVFEGKNKKYETIFFGEERFVKHVVDKMTRHLCEDITEIALSAFGEFAKSWSKAALSIADCEAELELVNSSVLSDTGYQSFFNSSYPFQSLLWKVDSQQTGIAIKDLT